MAAIIKLVDIDEAISHLNYKNKDTLKYKLVHAVRQYCGNVVSSELLHQIDTEDLIKNLWCIGDDTELVKSKRKNLSSVKSNINADLKRLYKEGKNPQGIIIGQNNVFDMSHEAKDKALETIADVLKEKGTDTLDKIAEVLQTANDILSDSGSVLTTEGGLEKLDRMKELLLDLSRKVGFSLPGGTGMEQISGTGTVTGIGNRIGSETGVVAATGTGVNSETIAATGIGYGTSIDGGHGTTDGTIGKDGGRKRASVIGAGSPGGLVRGRERADFGEVVDEILEDGSTVESDQTIKEEVIDQVVDETSVDLSEEGVEKIPEDVLAEDVDQSVEEQVIDELINDVPADVSEEIMNEIPQDESFEEIVQVSDEDLINEVVDEAEIGAISEGTDETVEELVNGTIGGAEIGINEELVDNQSKVGGIEETKHDTGATKENGECAVAEDDIDEEIQDHSQENLIVDEEDSVAALEEEGTFDEVAELMCDALPMDEPPVKADLDEIASDYDPEEVKGKEFLTEDSLPEEVLEDQQVIEGNSEEIATAASQFEETAGEEIIEEQRDVVDEIVDEDSYTKAEILAKLAEAAKVLVKLGPDFNDSIYSEEEIKEKAKLLSEDFERELSIREKYFNQHVLIKSGTYIIGGGNSGKYELPDLKVYIPEFYIGKFPVTNALFDIFVEKTGYTTTAESRGYGYVYTPRAQKIRDSATGLETFLWNSNLQYKKVQGACWYRPHGPGSSLYNKRRHPVVQISLEDARAFAAWTGKRIPGEKEWEAAARTSRGYIYPWGNEWRDNACNVEKSYFGDTTHVDKYLEFINEWGMADTLGNVMEWTIDVWKPDPSNGKNKDICVVKGGSWISDSSISLTRRFPMDKNTTSNILGFRCIAI